MLSINSCRVRRFTLIVAVILAAAIGSMASTSASTDSWYLLLNKSELNPPSYVFGIVWPILYILMMASAFLAHKKIFSIFIIQLIFNAAWSWLFFRFQMPLIALLDIYLLIAINIYILNLMYKENKLAFFLFIPYVVWISFASYLNLFIVINN
jgi:benzodiazapine receptor